MGGLPDDRAIFDNDDLAKIFGAPWFKSGIGNEVIPADSRYFQPHYYWLPLLGLYTGGRLNELSQLYLNDIQESKSDPGLWYVDFNLEGANKLDIDKSGVSSDLEDKSLKTVNSKRVVALHKLFVNLGLPQYVKALRDAGFNRLFPELRFDSVKGYGKAPGSWFNERFLGKQLKIPRDGTKSFHSFRHTFITKLFDNEIPEATSAQLAGHVRGKSESGQRYRKDQNAKTLEPYINSLNFELPQIMPFDAKAGVASVKTALDRKKRHQAEKERGRLTT